MDNNNNPVADISIDPNLLAPQGTPPQASTAHLIDITPGVTPTEPVAPMAPVAPLDPISPLVSTPTPDPVQASPLLSVTPSVETPTIAPTTASVPTPTPVAAVTAPVNPLSEDPNTVQTIG